jgi:hypothetical protein
MKIGSIKKDFIFNNKNKKIMKNYLTKFILLQLLKMEKSAKIKRQIFTIDFLRISKRILNK